MTSVRFLEAMPYIFEHEGGFNKIKGDAGGATNWGISLIFLKSINDDINHDGVVDSLDIKNLTKDQAIEIYYDNFWKPLFDKLPRTVGIKCFDISVNMGDNRSNILLQKALLKLGSNLKIDGVVGQATLIEVSKYSESALLNALCSSQKEYYDAIVASKPEQTKFLKGWYNRAKWTPS